MPRRLAAWLLLASSQVASPALADERAFEQALAGFREHHRAEIRRSGIVGSSFYVVHDGRITVADHIGQQDADAQRIERHDRGDQGDETGAQALVG